MTWSVKQGDALELLQQLEENSVDSIVQDGPAGISFMGRKWDDKKGYTPITERGYQVLAGLDLLDLPKWVSGFVAFMTEVFVEELRVIKPGSHMLAWALPRTADLTVFAMRLAGWEVRDSLVHLFGQGFPKSHDVSKAIDKAHGTERAIISVVAAGRAGSDDPTQSGGRSYRHGEDRSITAPATDAAKQLDGWGTALSPGQECWILARRPFSKHTPEHVRELLGSDHWWSSKRIPLTEKGRDAIEKRWPDVLEDFDAHAERHRLAAEQSPDDPPKAPAFSEHSGRPLAREVEGRIELRLDGDVIAKKSRPYSAAKMSGVAVNMLAWGVGGINVDGCRTPTSESTARPNGTVRGVYGEYTEGGQSTSAPGGRWPKNALLSCALACTPDEHTAWCPVGELDRQSGVLTSGSPTRTNAPGTVYGEYAPSTSVFDSGSGGASRYFTRFDQKVGYFAKASDRSVPGTDDVNKHPTHKHPKLMRWLVRLITPPGGHVLDAFNGSGTTGVAAVLEGLSYTGLELDPTHVKTSEARIGWAVAHPEYYK